MEDCLTKRVVILDAAKALPVDDLPGAILTNEALSELMTEAQMILAQRAIPRHIEISDITFPCDRVGIRSRRILDRSYSVQDLAIKAAQKVVKGRKDLDKIKLIVVSTVTADWIVPNISTALQAILDLPCQVQAIDIRVGCSGYVSALEVASRMLQAYPVGSLALVVGADCMSRVMDASDRNTCIIFGDGGGAILLGTANEEDESVLEEVAYSDPWVISSCESYTDGSKGELIEIKCQQDVPESIFRFVANDGKVSLVLDDFNKMSISMQGRSVYKDMLHLVPTKLKAHLASQGLEVKDIDLFLFHQANLRMIEAIAKHLGISTDKMYNNIEFTGNITNGCIPALMAETIQHNDLKQRRAFMVAFGTGYALSMANLKRYLS